MNIEKAIEIKQKYQYILRDASFPELIEADSLSIEALKAIQYTREDSSLGRIVLLAGETKD